MYSIVVFISNEILFGMDNDFTYRLYTISDLKDWLFQNANNGLTDAIISRPRALAFVNNPHARIDDPALAVVFNEKNEPVGYTGAYAERWNRPSLPNRYFWGSTQWMDVQYRGKGISAKMMRQIKDAVADCYIASESSAASCRLDQKQGSVISYYPRYFIMLNSNNKTLKSLIKNGMTMLSKSKAMRNLKRYNYSNRHVNWIDDETYSFVTNHGNGNLFLRSQDFLNWQMHYPFAIPVGNDCCLDEDKCEFGGYVIRLQTMMIKVYVDGEMSGFYVLRIVNSICSTWYLYCDESHSEQVFASVATNVLQLNGIVKFQTFNKELYDFMKRIGIRSQFSKSYIDKVSFTFPSGFEVDASLSIQGGDGDMMY